MQHIYNTLLSAYGPQGWWPLITHEGSNPTKSGSMKGYHPGDYGLPKAEHEVFEVICGAILTQNTAWPSVERALLNLHAHKALHAQALLSMPIDALKAAIRPAGYFNQKALYLRAAAEFFLSLNGGIPPREQLLSVKGVGPETADSILLYAYHQPEFVVDAYTRRIFSHLGHVSKDASYDAIKSVFTNQLPEDPLIYKEYHALIVEHAKRHYRKAPYEDPVLPSYTVNRVSCQ